ncbi:MAG: hypothetical protein KA391_01485 [Luteimonas sp.]|nr:hypothetical protein [Luteimonas sp.]
MSWIGLVLIVLGAYLAYKVAGALLKLLMFLLVVVGVYWFAAPYFGLPSVSDLVYVFGPDFGGQRIEEVARPSNIAGKAADRVVEGVIDRVALPLPEPAAADAVEPLPEPQMATPADASEAR